MQRLTILLLLLVFSVVANGQVYKWIDANGKTQYTDQPPPSGAAQDESKLNIKPVPPSSRNSSSTDENAGEGMQGFSERRTARMKAKEEKEKEAGELKKKCLDAQGRLQMYRDTPRLRMPDGSGGIAYVEDDVREKHIQDAQKDITAYY